MVALNSVDVPVTGGDWGSGNGIETSMVAKAFERETSIRAVELHDLPKGKPFARNKSDGFIRPVNPFMRYHAQLYDFLGPEDLDESNPVHKLLLANYAKGGVTKVTAADVASERAALVDATRLRQEAAALLKAKEEELAALTADVQALDKLNAQGKILSGALLPK